MKELTKQRTALMMCGVLIMLALCGCAEVNDGLTQETAVTDNGFEQAVDLIADIPTTQYFTDEPVSEEDIETILLAGVNAPSAMNGQKWHFSAVTDAEVLQQIASGMGGGFRPQGDMPEGMTPSEGMELPEGMEKPEGMELPEGAEFPEGMEKTEGMEIPEGIGKPEGGMPAQPTGGISKAGIGDAPLAIIVSCPAGSKLDAGLACQNMSAAAQLLGYGSKIISSPTMALNGEKQDEYREILGIPQDYSAVAVLLVGYEDTSVDETVDGYTSATQRNPMEDMVTYVVS